MKLSYWRIIPLVVFAMLVVFFWRGLSLDPQHLPSAKLGKALPEFELPIVSPDESEPRALPSGFPLPDGRGSVATFTPRVMRGQVVLLNVWASWCEACTEEQVFLMELARQGVAIYGLNYKDNKDDATHWLEEWGNPYKMVGSDTRGQVAIDLGVYGAPETVLVDKAGIIQYRHAGILTADVWQREFLPRMEGLSHAR